jgi:hypothetical protein
MSLLSPPATTTTPEATNRRSLGRQSPLIPHPDQVGGHGTIVRHENPHTLLKPVVEQELFVYRNAPGPLRRFMPAFHGVVMKEEQAGGGPAEEDGGFLELEDLTYGATAPCVLDVKIGTTQHTSLMPLAKRLYLERKCAETTSTRLGVRITGAKMRKGTAGEVDLGRKFSVTTDEDDDEEEEEEEGGLLFDDDDEGGGEGGQGQAQPSNRPADGGNSSRERSKTFMTVDRTQGKSMTAQDLLPFFVTFLSFSREPSVLAEGLLAELRGLREAVEHHPEVSGLRFLSSSLLFVYDAEAPKMVLGTTFKLKMIDFAHSMLPGESKDGPDAGYILGLTTLITILQDCLPQLHKKE